MKKMIYIALMGMSFACMHAATSGEGPSVPEVPAEASIPAARKTEIFVACRSINNTDHNFDVKVAGLEKFEEVCGDLRLYDAELCQVVVQSLCASMANLPFLYPLATKRDAVIAFQIKLLVLLARIVTECPKDAVLVAIKGRDAFDGLGRFSITTFRRLEQYVEFKTLVQYGPKVRIELGYLCSRAAVLISHLLDTCPEDHDLTADDIVEWARKCPALAAATRYITDSQSKAK